MSFTDEVKQELARVAPGDQPTERSELAALLRFGGALVVVGGARPRVMLDLETASGATIRRAFALLQRCYGLRPELRIRAPGGVQVRPMYGLRLEQRAPEVAGDLGLVTPDLLPRDPVPDVDAQVATATARGAFLAAGSLSSPDRAPHLEVAAHHAAAATALAATLRALTTGTVSVPTGSTRPRVVVKSGAAIGELLVALGAGQAFLRWDERRLRRQLRAEATRLTNADAANLRRSIEAASAQVRAVEQVVAAVGWDALDDDLRQVALARLTSPEASLTDLGELTDPPLTRSTLHRRLKRLEAMAREIDDAPSGGPPAGAP